MIRVSVLALTLVTGFAGLVYEVVWQRYVAILLGSDSESTAAVLGIFLGGLALGYAVFGIWTRRVVQRGEQRGAALPLLSLYGGVEFLIGVYALIFPWTFAAIQQISLGLFTSSAGLSFFIDVLLTALLIGPPAFLMGATIPMLTQGLPRKLEESTRIHAWVYGLNAGGAFAGALAAGFYFIPQLGLVGTVRGMGCLNLAAGLILVGLGALSERAPLPVSVSEPLRQRTMRGYGLFAAAALLSGFAMMSIQVVLNRLGALALGASHFTFSIVVAAFVLSIALGSMAVSQFQRIPPIAAAVSQWILAVLLIGMYVFATQLNYAAHVLRTAFTYTDTAFFAFHVAVFLCMLAILVVPVGLSGALLPLLFHNLRRESEEWGAVAGRLYSWNTFGSLLGALLGGYILLFWVDLHSVFRIATVAVALSAVLLSFCLAGSRGRVFATVAFAAVFVTMVWLPPWPAQVLSMGAFKLRAETPETLLGHDAFVEARKGSLFVLFHADGPNTSTTIFDDEGSRALYVNGKANGNDKFDYTTMALSALIPALLAERTERVFVVGYGLGITVGELAALDSVESVTVAEISRSVMEGAPFFDDSNLGARENPKVEILHGDAYRALLRGEGLYDLIVSEPSHPWVLGVEMVYSQEFLEQARARLHPHGIYAQWIHRYEIDSKTIDLVLSTYTSVFEDVSIWYTVGRDLLVVGFNRKGGVDSLDRLIERASRRDVMEAFERLNLSSISAFLAHEIVPVGVLSRERLPDTVHTLQHPRLSHVAAKAFFRDPPQPPIPKDHSAEALRAGANNSLARRYAENLDATDLEAHREAMVSEACKYLVAECIVLLSEWLAENPESPALLRLANELNNDPDLTRSLSSGVPRVISTLFDRSSDNLPESLSVAEARFWEKTFFTNYEYVAPFDLEVLPEIWRRCVDEDPALCEEGLREIEQKLK